MKKTFCLLTLLISVSVNLCAQSGDKTFEVPEYIIFNRKFTINLDNGNKLVIRLSDINDLQQLTNIDSIIQVFLKDINSLKDSIADNLNAKRIDYVTDAQNRKKIRLQQYPSQGTSFLVNRGELAALKTTQDTIHIIGILPYAPKPADRTSLGHPRYYHFSFYLNDWAEISNYMNGVLNARLKTLQTAVNGKWATIKGSSQRHLQSDNTITANAPRGHASEGDFVAGYITVNAENYKRYFTPSFTVGVQATLTNRQRSFKWVPALLWEPHFFFAKDLQGKLKTYRNDFVTLAYAQGGTTDHDPRKEFAFSAHFSLGYLVHRSGDFIDKNTFCLGGGKVQIRKTSIEPCMYFNNLFKGVSPAIKISQSF